MIPVFYLDVQNPCLQYLVTYWTVKFLVKVEFVNNVFYRYVMYSLLSFLVEHCVCSQLIWNLMLYNP